MVGDYSGFTTAATTTYLCGVSDLTQTATDLVSIYAPTDNGTGTAGGTVDPWNRYLIPNFGDDYGVTGSIYGGTTTIVGAGAVEAAVGMASAFAAQFRIGGWHTWPEETAEQRRVRLAEEAQRKAAEKKANRLLYDIIGRRRYRQYKKRGYLDAVGRSGAKYRLRAGKMIEVLNQDKIDHRLCIVSSEVPPTDVLIQELLHIVSGDEEFIRKVGIKHAA